MRVLGIDPGLTRCGWGVVEGRPGARPTALGVGVIRTMAELDLELRLLELHSAVTALLREHRPDVVAIGAGSLVTLMRWLDPGARPLISIGVG